MPARTKLFDRWPGPGNPGRSAHFPRPVPPVPRQSGSNWPLNARNSPILQPLFALRTWASTTAQLWSGPDRSGAKVQMPKRKTSRLKLGIWAVALAAIVVRVGLVTWHARLQSWPEHRGTAHARRQPVRRHLPSLPRPPPSAALAGQNPPTARPTARGRTPPARPRSRPRQQMAPPHRRC